MGGLVCGAAHCK